MHSCSYERCAKDAQLDEFDCDINPVLEFVKMFLIGFVLMGVFCVFEFFCYGQIYPEINGWQLVARDRTERERIDDFVQETEENVNVDVDISNSEVFEIEDLHDDGYEMDF